MNKNIFDRDVSIYNGVRDSYGIVRPLSTFLFDKKHIAAIEQLRSVAGKEERNRIKRTLPQCAISGIFSPTRKAENLVQHSGLICIDIDSQDNPGLDIEELKDNLKILPQIAYMSFSVSRSGLFLIIPIKYSNEHKRVFKSLQNDFLRMGIRIDKNCGDVCRLRCLSHDLDPYVNELATTYQKVAEPPRPVHLVSNFDGGDVFNKVFSCCRQIADRGIDLTSDYESWYRVGASLASLGESGRTFFHVCSQQNPGYNESETDKKFNNLLHNTNRFSIGSFFYICKEMGIFTNE